jgi:arylsulfatase A-like enzyme
MNVLILDIDSLRPDHLGCYGYGKDTSPRIDGLAGDSTVFTRAYAASSPSLPSRASLMTGRYSVSHGVVSHGTEALQVDSPEYWPAWRKKDWEGDLSDWWMLPERFFRSDFHAVGISSEPRHPAPWINQAWDEFHQPREPEGPMETQGTVRGEDVADRALDALKRVENEFFMYVQFWDPHIPCNRSEEEVESFRGELPGYLEEVEFKSDGWNGPPSLDIEDRDDLEEIAAGYDAEISYADRQVGRLLDELERQGIYDETLVVLVGDHGEEFGENGVFREHWSVHEGTQRIPVIMKPPYSTGGERRDELVTNVDLAPTLADYADLELPGRWQGESVRRLVEEKDAEDWREKIVVDHGLYTVQRALIREDGKKLVKTLHDGMKELPREQLFDLENDRYEREELSGEFPELVEEMEEEMEEWVEDRLVTPGDPLQKLAERGPVAYRYNG